MSQSPSSSPLTTFTPAPQTINLEALAESQRFLRKAFHITLVMIVILTGSLSVFFMREIGIARRQIGELTRVVADYENNSLPRIQEFRAKLEAFSQAYPDFLPIYAKYFGTNPGPANVAAPRLPPPPR